MIKKEFETYNPLVIFIYFAAVIGIGVCMSSLFIIIAFTICGWAYSIYLKGSKALKTNIIMTVPVVLFITVFNTLFIHQGNTMIFYINNNPITIEALVFGIFSGLMLSNVLIWFSSFNRVVNGEMIMYLFSRLSSFFGLLISMILRYIPLLKKRYEDISAGQRCIYQGDEKKGMARYKTFLSKISILTSWSLESSIESADSMAARGYGLKGRTGFVLYRISVRDVAMISLVVILTASAVYLALSGNDQMVFYPEIDIPEIGSRGIISGIIFMILAMIPVITDIVGEFKWKKSGSEI